jgi:hypothetical protein
LPNGIDLADLSPTKTTYASAGGGPSPRTIRNVFDLPQFSAQKDKVPTISLREPNAIDVFYKDYFKGTPKMIFDSWDELEKSLKSPKDLELYFSGIDHVNIKNRVNEIIRLRNMYAVYNESEQIRKDFNSELEESLHKLQDAHQIYYQAYKGKPDRDFAADLIGGKLSASGPGPQIATRER